jgi:hypothetical protein
MGDRGNSESPGSGAREIGQLDEIAGAQFRAAHDSQMPERARTRRASSKPISDSIGGIAGSNRGRDA